MGFLEKLFSKKENSESVVLIDIGATSIAGAYARYEENQSPMLVYTRRLPIERRNDEVHELAMLRALEILCKDLIREGAPALFRITGSGSANMILVSVDAPWQETNVRTEYFESKEKGDSFIFTRGLVSKKLEETRNTRSDKLLTNESIIGTILNGYNTNKPYGERVHRAMIIILTSLIEREVATSILSTLGGLYHTKDIMSISGDSLRYQTLQTIFPHERDAIILDAIGGSITTVSLIRQGVFVTMEMVSVSSDDNEWVPSITSQLREIAKSYPLPRTIFLLANEPEISSLRQRLDTADFGLLWLSENPPKIVSVLKSQIGGSVRYLATTPPDLVLLLMTIYYGTKHKLHISGEDALLD